MAERVLINEGKTKKIYQAEEERHLVVIENKDDITKNDNPDETRQMEGKAKYATATTCSVFEILKKAGLPVAYERQLSETEFLARKCEMIPLEVIIRRYAVGSFLKRYPNLKEEEGIIPHRFHRLEFELFLKTTGGVIRNIDGYKIGDIPIHEATGGIIDDPFISSPHDHDWILKHPKIPEWESGSDLKFAVSKVSIFLDPEDEVNEIINEIEEIARKVFLVLESAWAQLGCRLIDFKIEFGIDEEENLLVSDVIDNDSWRVRTSGWEELSKQLFRDNFAMEDIVDKYELVAKLVERFSIPEQAIVFWRGSDKDEQLVYDEIAGIKAVNVIKSGHKFPQECLNILEPILAMYPEGGVILACVGRSNGLGPILSARTSWPVIGVPLTAKSFPDDLWSSLRTPSQVPMATICEPENAILAALNILAQKNPVAYMHRQYAIEQLDY